MHISISKFLAYSTNFRHVLQPPQSTFLGQAGRIFLFSFFCRIFFGRRIFRSDLKHLVQNLQKQIPDLDSSRKITTFQKKIGSNRSSDVGDIADLKSAILSEFL